MICAAPDPGVIAGPVLLLAALFVSLASCGRSTLDQIPPPDTRPACALGLAGLPTCAPPEATACLDFVSPPTSTPAAEILAWRLDDTFLATRASFNRIRGDLELLAAADPMVAYVLTRSLSGCMEVWVSFDAATQQAIGAGTYSAWDCINGLYGATLFGGDPARLSLSAHYNDRIVARQYAALPGTVKVTSGCSSFGYYQRMNLCVARQGASLSYSVTWGSGDCPMGCIYREYRYYVVDASGSITTSGAWKSGWGGPMPAWINNGSCIGTMVSLP